MHLFWREQPSWFYLFSMLFKARCGSEGSNSWPLRVNPKLWGASLLLYFMLYRLKYLSEFLVSSGDEVILSTSLQHADKALNIKCWLAGFHFACVMLVSHPRRNQSPCLFFCMYIQWAVVWPAGKNGLGSQDRGKKWKYVPFSVGNVRQREKRSSLP